MRDHARRAGRPDPVGHAGDVGQAARVDQELAALECDAPDGGAGVHRDAVGGGLVCPAYIARPQLEHGPGGVRRPDPAGRKVQPLDQRREAGVQLLPERGDAGQRDADLLGQVGAALLHVARVAVQPRVVERDRALRGHRDQQALVLLAEHARVGVTEEQPAHDRA